MSLNKQKGNMYPWVSHTWNPIRGECPHQCTYCYMRGFKVGKLRLEPNVRRDNLGSNRVIFVGSSTDMWANAVPWPWILDVITHCGRFDNTYLFQSKNPARFWVSGYPENFVLGTTLETNRNYPGITQAPSPLDRQGEMQRLSARKMISIEPIMDFDLLEFAEWIRAIQPEFISVGADSKGHKLPEPSREKLEALIEELQQFTEVKLKSNLRRLGITVE